MKIETHHVYANTNVTTLIYKQWHSIRGSCVLFVKFFKKIASKSIHIISVKCLHTHARVHAHTFYTTFFSIMREWPKSPFSSWKSLGNFLPINNSKLKWKKIHTSELMADWNHMRDCLLLTPKMEKKGKKEYKLHKPKKNCFWIVAVNSIMLCDHSHMHSNRLF